MVSRTLTLLTVTGLLGACAGQPMLETSGVPTNPMSLETPITPRSGVLDLRVADVEMGPSESFRTKDSAMPNTGMDMPGMGGMDMHSDHSQPSSQSATVQAAADYTCKMHPQIHQDHPGNCAICGMTLVKKEKDASAQKGGAK